MKPLIVYVSGAPGSGKTTLAKLLSDQLYVPQVSSDLVHGGIALSEPNHDRKETLKDVFVPLMIFMAENGISFVVDHVLQKGASELTIIDKLRTHGSIVYIHTEATNPIERYVERVKTSSLPSIVDRQDHLLNLTDHHKENLSNTAHPLDLELPTIVVNTDDGYTPNLDEIIQFIKTSYKR